SENITSLLTQCRGVLVFSGGLYRLEIEGTKAPSFALDADNIISHAGIKSGGKRQRFNRVKVEFTNPQTNWEKDFAIAESATLLAADGGLLLETTINRPFETDPYRAQYAAELVLKKSRESIAVSVVASHEALMVEVGDVVTVTHEPAGWVAKQFRAATVEIRPDLTVGLGLVEYEPTTYDRTIPASAFVSPPNTSLPDPSVVAPPSGVAVASGTAHLLTMGDGTLVTRAWVSWTASPDAYVDSYEVQAKLTTGAWGGVGIQGTVRVSADETGAYVYPVADGVNYDFRVRAVNTAGARSTWALFVGHLVLGKQEVPAIPNLVAYTTTASGRRRLTWRMPVVTPDLAGFEIRYYPALTGGGWNAASKLVDGLVAVDPNVAPPNGDYSFEWDHLPAGDYQFYVRPWDTSGLTSINAASSGGVTLPAPPLTSADWSQVTGLGRPQDNADVTANNTAAGIAGQGALATANSADWQTQVTGAGRPQDNADVTQQVIDTGILTTGAVWMNSGTFGAKGIQAEYNNGTPRLHVGDGANSYIRHDGTLLTWKAANTELDVAGNLTATNATFDNATMTNATVSGAITVGAGSSGISNLADAGAFATLNQINSANIGSYIADLSVDTLQI
ncbi:MAG: phage tail protein, partial [Leptospirillia bacterium]